jgi:eukaryotic-like serine/threonine-protein kinase
VDFLVMEYIPGITLNEKLAARPLSEKEVLHLGEQLAEGLCAAHEHGVVHRDLKPGNIRVTSDGRLKILDFGLAKLRLPVSDSATTESLSETQAMAGTLPYMAPEQLLGGEVDTRTDVHAVGSVLYEMATGQRPFCKLEHAQLIAAILRQAPAPPRQLNPQVSPELERIIGKCLEKEPENRYQSAKELAIDLRRLLTPSAAKAAEAPVGSRNLWKLLAPAALILVTAAIGGTLYFRSRNRLTDKDTIVLADFSNSTGDAIFDDTLRTGLSISVQQSPFLNVLSDNKVVATLSLMTRPAGTKLTPELARELCQRAGSKAYLAGSIGSLGSEYVLGLKAVNCQSGETLAEEQVMAVSKEKVLDALGKAATKMRGELGESLVTVHKLDVPLYEATTSSLEALKAYTLGAKAAGEKGSAAALPHYQRAIELDPKFAMAQRAVGVAYLNLGQPERANEYLSKAFQSREHASEGEKLDITAMYYVSVTGELDKAAQTLQAEIESYPRRVGTTRAVLSDVLALQGQYQKAVEISRQGLRLAPGRIYWYVNIAIYTRALQHFDEARQIIREAQANKLDADGFHSELYLLAFLRSDSGAMSEQQQWFADNPKYGHVGLSLASDTEAFAGHPGKARELTKRAVDSAILVDSRETGAIIQATAAQWEAAYGYAAKARQVAAEALKLSPGSKRAEVEAALAFALAGDAAQAESSAQDLEKRIPLDTQLQSVWLPAIQAQLALNRKNPALALNVLQAATHIELGAPCLYPTYLRGEAYLAAGQGMAAAAEFQKVHDHSGIVCNCWTGAMAHLGLARANALQARTSQGADADVARIRALAAYKEFLTLWKDADPDIPILKQAKAEYAKMRKQRREAPGGVGSPAKSAQQSRRERGHIAAE